MPTVLITGSSGLVGSECVRHFASLGWQVHGLDSNARRSFFGPDGDTSETCARLSTIQQFEHHEQDITDHYAVLQLVADIQPDLIIHAAAQPSHDWAATNPIIDFDVNARATLNLLESARQHAPQAAFCFLSTNKVFGDAPNALKVKETSTRYEFDFPQDHPFSISEWLQVDYCTHSLFGCSKLAADIYVQEYGRYFGMNTCCFRCGCLTGGSHAGAEQHGFLAYLAKCCREGRPYKVYGYKGKQVRDQLHAYDVARACEEFFKSPRQGEVYNLGGGRENSVSVLEAIAMVERRTCRKLRWEYIDEPRKGDHIVWISDTSKFRSHYPEWKVTRTLVDIISELCDDRAVCLS